MKELIENLRNANGLEAYEKASDACIEYFATANDADKEILRKVMMEEANSMIEKSKESSRLANELIAQFDKKEIIIEVNGEKYPLKEWVTIKEYCKQFGIKNTMIVSNWISRKIVPAENILHIKELNDMKLIKAIPYMQ